jgi:flagellar biosynthesis/type III secretory pathway chaperone
MEGQILGEFSNNRRNLQNSQNSQDRSRSGNDPSEHVAQCGWKVESCDSFGQKNDTAVAENRQIKQKTGELCHKSDKK